MIFRLPADGQESVSVDSAGLANFRPLAVADSPLGSALKKHSGASVLLLTMRRCLPMFRAIRTRFDNV